MSKVTVVTDSSACLPADLVAAFDISVLPISVLLPEDGGRLVETADGTTWRLPAALEDEERTGANHPFVTEYLAAIEVPGYDAAVVITPAIEFATMFRNAALASELSARPARALDARTAAAGQALVVLAGAEAAAAGADIAEVVRTAEDASRRVELVASLATLEPLRLSGPVPEEVLGATDFSGSRSVFRMRAGMVEPLGAAGTTEETLAQIAQQFRASTPNGVERSSIFHADAPELAARLEALIGPVDFVSGFSVAMQVHTGAGVVGAAWIPAERA